MQFWKRYKAKKELRKAKEELNKRGAKGRAIDFGAGLGEGAKILKADTYEPLFRCGTFFLLFSRIALAARSALDISFFADPPLAICCGC